MKVAGGAQTENLTYRYQRDDQQKLIRNRLYHVNDSVPAYLDSTDIDDMGFFHSSPDSISRYNNYVYDPEGRLVKSTICWIQPYIYRRRNGFDNGSYL